MKTVRIVASVLYQLTRMTAVLVILIGLYAAAVVLLYLLNPSAHPPMEVLANKTFQIFFPFTHAPFLLGDFTAAYLISNLFTLFFYGIFLGMLSEVLNAF